MCCTLSIDNVLRSSSSGEHKVYWPGGKACEVKMLGYNSETGQRKHLYDGLKVLKSSQKPRVSLRELLVILVTEVDSIVACVSHKTVITVIMSLYVLLYELVDCWVHS